MSSNLCSNFISRKEFERFIRNIRVGYQDPKIDSKDWIGNQQTFWTKHFYNKI